MDKKAVYDLTYGVFLLTTMAGNKVNGCISNTCIQVASNPLRLALSVLNTNYTCDLIKESGVFAVSILDETALFETIKHFGMQSGRNIDKIGTLNLPPDSNGVPYLGWQACAVLSGKVISSTNLGTHTLFIAEVTDAKKLSDNKPLTYADYQERIKPKPEKRIDKKVVAWRCKICGYEYKGSELPADYSCPLCGHGAEDFEPVYE